MTRLITLFRDDIEKRASVKLAAIKLANPFKDEIINAQDANIARADLEMQKGQQAGLNRPVALSPYDRAYFDEASGRWKLVDKAGYIRLYDDKPSMKNFLKYQYEHRKVMEEMLKRQLEINEIIHHLDGNRSNNSPANLRLEDDHIAHMRTEHPEWRKGLTGRE